MKAELILKAGREKSVLQRHPWIFSGAVGRFEGKANPGETVDVISAHGEWLAKAAYNPNSNIRARIWTWEEGEAVDEAFLRKRMLGAIQAREAAISDGETSCKRLVHAESDGLPGVILDRYNDILVMQCLTAGAEFWRETIARLACEVCGVGQVFERSDVDVRKLEGLPERVGQFLGSAVDRYQIIKENGLSFKIDLVEGHKTGFYLDQRLNRKLLGELVRGKEVLNCFCYSGAFSVYAMKGGAKQVLSVDSSQDAIVLGQENMALNGLQGDWLEGDVFKVLRTFRDEAKKFDAIILDPPKFAPTAAQAERAARGYKDINLLALKLLRPGGLLFTFSCSGGISGELFQKIVAGAALDAMLDVRILYHLAQGPDHPVALNFPEGMYLKGLVCQIAG